MLIRLVIVRRMLCLLYCNNRYHKEKTPIMMIQRKVEIVHGDSKKAISKADTAGKYVCRFEYVAGRRLP